MSSETTEQVKSQPAAGSSCIMSDRGMNQGNPNHRESPSSGCESDDSIGVLDETGSPYSVVLFPHLSTFYRVYFIH